MTLPVSLYIVPGDETFATQSTLIQILHRMRGHVFFHLEAEFESTVTQNTIVIKFVGITLQVVAGDQDLATQMTVLGIFHSTRLYVPLDVILGDEFLSTYMWIAPSMALLVHLYIVPEDKTFTTHSTLI